MSGHIPHHHGQGAPFGCPGLVADVVVVITPGLITVDTRAGDVEAVAGELQGLLGRTPAQAEADHDQIGRR